MDQQRGFRGIQDSHQAFDALDVSMRAALVFRYREGLPLAHVAQLVGRPARKLGPEIERVLGVLGLGEQDLAELLEERRGDPALSSFSLVRAVRAEQNRPGLVGGIFRGLVMRRFA